MDPVTIPVAVDAVASSILHDLILLGIAVFTAVTAAFGAFKAFKSEALSKANATSIHELKVTVDGRLEELLKITRTSSFAAGQKDEAMASTMRSAAEVATMARVHEARAEGAMAAPVSQPVPTPVAVVTDVVTAEEGQELVIRAEHAKVETDKTATAGKGDLIIKADGAKIQSKGKEK